MKAKSNRVFSGIFNWTKLLLPDYMLVENNRVVIKKRKLLGLKSNEERVVKNQMASVRANNGLFFSTIYIETTGGATKDLFIKWIGKGKAKKIVNETEKMIMMEN